MSVVPYLVTVEMNRSSRRKHNMCSIVIRSTTNRV